MWEFNFINKNKIICVKSDKKKLKQIIAFKIYFELIFCQFKLLLTFPVKKY